MKKVAGLRVKGSRVEEPRVEGRGERLALPRGKSKKGAEGEAARSKRAAPDAPAPAPEAPMPEAAAPEHPNSERLNASSPTPSRWRVISAAVIGASHQKAGLPCQDATGWRITAQGVLLAAASDGAGSAERSAEGARCAVQTALDYLESSVAGSRVAEPEGEAAEAEALPAEEEDAPDSEPTAPELANTEVLNSKPPDSELLNSDLIFNAFMAARAALAEMAEAEQRPLRDFAATLSLVMAGDDFLAAGAIGDCAVIGSNGSRDDDLHTLIPLERGEYANETHFLTGDDAAERIRVVLLPQRPARLALFSDGLARLALQWPEQTPHKPFFAPLFAFALGIPPAPAPGEAPPAAPLFPGQPADAPADVPMPGGENAAIFAGAAAQLAAFLASARVNARTDDDKALVLAVSE